MSAPLQQDRVRSTPASEEAAASPTANASRRDMFRANPRVLRETWIKGGIGLAVIGLVIAVLLRDGDETAPAGEAVQSESGGEAPGPGSSGMGAGGTFPDRCEVALRDEFQVGDTAMHGPGLAVVPEGAYGMGELNSTENDEKSGRSVTLSHPVAISTCEVSATDYMVFVRDTGRSWPADSAAQADLPATMVSWHDAVAYAKWLASKTGKPYRLPSEAEWEWAARNGYESGWPWGDSPGPICRYANLRGAVTRAGVATPCNQTGSGGVELRGIREPSEWGLHDLFGNVAEWTADCYAEYSNEPSTGAAVDMRDCKERVFRGGAWINRPEHARPGFRAHAPAEYRDYFVGFRVARDATEEELAAARHELAEAVAMPDVKQPGAPDSDTASPSGPSASSATAAEPVSVRSDLAPYLAELESDDEKVRRAARDRLAAFLAERDDPNLTRAFIATADAPEAGYRRWIGVTEVIVQLGQRTNVPRIADPDGAVKVLESLAMRRGADDVLKKSIYEAVSVLQRSRERPAAAA